MTSENYDVPLTVQLGAARLHVPAPAHCSTILRAASVWSSGLAGYAQFRAH